MNSIILLAFEYFKIGCVAIGGYTVVPFLFYISEKYNWFTISDISQIIAISNLTPGPIGINMATFIGLKVGGIISAILTTTAFMLPSFAIVCLISKLLKKQSKSKYIENILYGLKPAATALITITGIKILQSNVLSIEKNNFAFDLTTFKTLILLAIFTYIGLNLKKNPMILIAIAIITGLIIKI
jgi:chromate transporter